MEYKWKDRCICLVLSEKEKRVFQGALYRAYVNEGAFM